LTSAISSEDLWELSSGTEFLRHSWKGTLEYEFRDKYQIKIDLTSEKVGYYREESLYHQKGFFPSFNLGWVFTNENFISRKWIYFGKLRYGWGRVGNSPRINYSFFADMMKEMEYVYAMNNKASQLQSPFYRKMNERFYWEKVQAQNLGIDMGFFSNKLFFSFDYYINLLKKGKTDPIDEPKAIYQQLNEMQFYGVPSSPVANMINKGFELEISYRYTRGDLSWNVSLNAARLNNKILDISENIESTNYDIIAVNNPGEKAGSFYGYHIERLFTTDDCDYATGLVTNQPYTLIDGNKIYAQPLAKAGDYKFEDMNGDGEIDDEDKMILGNPFPDIAAGFNLAIAYKNIDCSIFLQGTWGNEIFNITKFWTYNPYGFSNWTSGILNSYRLPRINRETGEYDPGNTDTGLHRIDPVDANQNLRISDFYVEDGSYLRLKHIQLGYTLSAELTRKIHIQKFRVYFASQNLFTWTNYSGLDPEVGGWGIDCGIYPQPRIYMAGVNLEF
jgi:hypothetical protein